MRAFLGSGSQGVPSQTTCPQTRIHTPAASKPGRVNDGPNVGNTELGVHSRSLVYWIEPESFGLFCPDIADVFVGREPYVSQAMHGAALDSSQPR